MTQQDTEVTPLDDDTSDHEQGIHIAFAGRERHMAIIEAPHVLTEVPEHSDLEGSPENLVIEGDNIDAMASLRAQFSEQVDVVLTDPPYGGDRKNLRYPDGNTGWLNQMLPTFHLIQGLLAETGVMFVHIDDDNLFTLGMLLDDIFGKENRLGIIVWKNATDNNPTQIATEHEYILCFAKNKASLGSAWRGFYDETRELMLAEYHRISVRCPNDKKLATEWAKFVRAHQDEIGGLDHYTKADRIAPYRLDNLGNPGKEGYRYDVPHPNGPPARQPLRGWRCPESTMLRYLDEGRIDFGKDEDAVPQFKRYLTDSSEATLRGIVEHNSQTAADEIARLFPEKPHVFKWPKPTAIEEYLLSFAANKTALVLDPFAGSGTTAHAVMLLNKRDKGERRFIVIERGNLAHHDEYAVELTAERIKRARTVDGLPGGFTFLRVGEEINDQAWERMRRDEVVRVIRQADPSGKGRGLTRINGRFVIGANARKQAICLHWGGDEVGAVSRDVLRAMFEEVAELGLRLPMRVYGTTCDVAETEDFTFCQLPDEAKFLLGTKSRNASA